MAKHSMDRVHWAKVLKIITEHEPNGLAVYDIADELFKEHGDINIDMAVNQLLKQGKIRLSLGRSKTGIVSRIANITVERETARTTVDLLDQRVEDV